MVALVAGTALLALRRSTRLPARGLCTAPPSRPKPDDTRLGRAAKARVAYRGRKSGIHLLTDAQDAFAARVLMARQAERTLDMQYYIWHGDLTGTLMLDEVLRAAERGVRVRLLLDDNGVSGMDRILSAMNRHPLIEIRIFNPFLPRFPKSLGFLLDFKRLNRRMHNKCMIADNAVAIVGGRNIGDEYFGAGDGGLFTDLDALAIGPVVQDVSHSFDAYWSADSAYPAQSILGRGPKRMLKRLHRRAAKIAADPGAMEFIQRIAAQPIIARFLTGNLDLEWGRVRVMADDPDKVLGKAKDSPLGGRLFTAMGRPETELGIVAGYFVPGHMGIRHLTELARNGVNVSVMTNGYEATDTGIVHAGYAPARRQLLRAGVRLFEMRAYQYAGVNAGNSHRGIGSIWRGTGQGSTARLRSRISTLHAKTFTVDRKRLFIGSFNFDPRSWELNTEIGFVVDSPALAARVADAFESAIPQCAYEVQLHHGRMQWLRRSSTDFERLQHEPGLRLPARAVLGTVRLLRLQWLL